MTRISILTPDEMNAEQRAVIDASKANGRPHGGPFWAYIRNPKLMQNVQNVGASIADSTLSAREQQIVTLTVTRFWDAKYPWAAQCRNALKVGLTQQEIDAINTAPRCPPITSASCSPIRSLTNCSLIRDYPMPSTQPPKQLLALRRWSLWSPGSAPSR